MNESTGRIKLEGLHNTRDLGGLKTADGRLIKPARLIRSGALYDATPDDLRILVEEYHLGTVVDFRTGAEQKQNPDPEIETVRNLFNPILDEQTVGITYEEQETPQKEAGLSSVMNLAASLGSNPLLYVDRLYEDLAANEHAQEYYGKFFTILLEADERAVLWHCSAGKDRVGVGTALLLTALGVERETVIKDFLKTNEYIGEGVKQTVSLIEEKTGDKKAADCVRVLLSVSEDYIRHAFGAMERISGSAENYLEEKIGLTPEKMSLLQEKYLTKRG